MILFWVICAAIFLGLIFLLGLRNRGSTKGYLDWDPQERQEWKRDQVDVDREEMLELANRNRLAEGKEALTMEEYEERVRRNQPRG